MIPIRDAATIIMLRRDADKSSVLMGMRGANAVFMPSKFVFPGGAVDPEDASIALSGQLAPQCYSRLLAEPRQGHSTRPNTIAAAALRELAEETGLLIGRSGDCPWPGYAEAGLAPDASALTYLFRAITPPGRPRRFDAYFFVADTTRITGDPDDFSRACDELSHLHWVPLDQAGQLDLPFITEVALAELTQLVDNLPYDVAIPCPTTVPFFDNRTDVPRFCQIA
ncbi:NUDIX domain-containing protein [Paracoccus sp. JM45]|uniref:NUDIX domain-containing protein n=1 Tax=Paracoccus sp. JM45 TaxID=2283626 RepID=UPI000E6C59A7|nr:NUDIX domain-containing protein [Paracoccus sp. JM45]RJE80128.1 NUDIX domain-containing protein [Paracoccus sp. JM45]